MKIRTKIWVFVFLSVLITSGVFSFVLIKNEQRDLMLGVDEKLKAATRLAYEIVPTNYHDSIQGKNSVSKADYDSIVKRYNQVCKDLNIQYLWSNIKLGEAILFTSATSPDHQLDSQKHAAFFSTHNDPEAFSEVFREMQPVFKEFRNEWGHGRMLLVPYIDRHGRPYVFGASMSLEHIDEMQANTLYQSLIVSVAIMLLMILLASVFAHNLSRPIVQISDYARRVSNDEKIPLENVSGNFEVQSLSYSINQMIEALREKEKSELFEALMDILPIAIGTINQDLKLQSSNHFGAKMWGRTPKRMVGHSVQELFGDDGARFCRDLMQGESQNLVREVPINIQGKSIIFYGIGMRFNEDQNGLIVGIDITEKKRQEELLIVQSRLAAMGEMIGNIAHQWRQPIASIGMAVQNIRNAYDFGKLDSEYLDDRIPKIANQVEFLSETIDDFRNFFKPDLEKEYFLPIESIHDALSIVEGSLKQAEIAVVKDYAESVKKVSVYGYSGRFTQVILNILQNAQDALKNTTSEQRRIQISCFLEDETISLTFADNGTGIAPENMTKIFEPYFTTKIGDEGTGIGLYMSKIIVENHMHGKLNVINQTQGVAFQISLPIETLIQK